MVGEKYGMLTVRKEFMTTLPNGKRKRMSECICDCGNIVTKAIEIANRKVEE